MRLLELDRFLLGETSLLDTGGSSSDVGGGPLLEGGDSNWGCSPLINDGANSLHRLPPPVPASTTKGWKPIQALGPPHGLAGAVQEVNSALKRDSKLQVKSWSCFLGAVAVVVTVAVLTATVVILLLVTLL